MHYGIGIDKIGLIKLLFLFVSSQTLQLQARTTKQCMIMICHINFNEINIDVSIELL